MLAEVDRRRHRRRWHQGTLLARSDPLVLHFVFVLIVAKELYDGGADAVDSFFDLAFGLAGTLLAMALLERNKAR